MNRLTHYHHTTLGHFSPLWKRKLTHYQSFHNVAEQAKWVYSSCRFRGQKEIPAQTEGGYTLRCFYHNDVEAVGTCSKCGKAACRPCIEDIGGALLCKDCTHLVRAELAQQATEEAAPFKRAIRRSWVIAALGCAFFLFGGYLQVEKEPSLNAGVFLFLFLLGPILGAYFFWSWYWGYRALARLQPRIFLILPLIGWVIYFMIKLTLGGTYGFLGGGIYEYLKSRRLAAADH